MISSLNPEISVVIPVKNGELYLREALDSIFKQSYQQFRILILESGSQDDSLSIINFYQDTRLTVFSDTSNLGIEGNWARILDLELSEYVTILGQDDVLYPDFLNEMVQLIASAPDASLFQAHFDLIDEDGEIIRACKPMPYRETGEGYLRSRQTFKRDSFGTGYVMRSADYKQIGGLPSFPKLICADDVAWYQLAHLSYMVCSSKNLFGYRYHRKSTSYMVDLYVLYSAFKQYWGFLSKSDYFASVDNSNTAHRYISTVFNKQYHRELIFRALAPDDKWKEQYALTRNRLLSEAKEDDLFSVYDRTSALLEFYVRLRPAFLRRWIANAVVFFADVRRLIRNKVIR